MKVPSRLERSAVLLTLSALAVTRPILDVLGFNAEFFLAHRSPPSDIFAVAAILGIGLPLVAGSIGLIGGRLGRWMYHGLAWLLAAILFRLAYSLALGDGLATAGGVLVGAGVVWIIGRKPALREVARYLVVAPFLFTGLFLVGSPTASLVRGEEFGSSAEAGTPLPLVLIVFDEFPSSSLMDVSGSVHGDRYPNFSRLARDAVWFPNAATVEERTKDSLPAILTGVQPTPGYAPFAGQYPDNLFTALAGSHELAVFESLTQLCPSVLCVSESEEPLPGARLALLFSDISILAGHALLPHRVSSNLPPIDQGWGNFGRGLDFNVPERFKEAFDLDPRVPFREASARMTNGFGELPPFIFVHALVPHHPWELLPTGQRYPRHRDRAPGRLTDGGWGHDQWLVSQATQRHLINVGYADHALGRILDQLEASGFYEEAVIIVVADHGIILTEGATDARTMTTEFGGQIAGVPLLVKAPGLVGGTVDSRRVLTTDIVPTIADVMSLQLGWDPDGTSLLAENRVETDTIVHTLNDPVIYNLDNDEVLEAAAELAVRFPDPDPFSLRPPGAPDLVGDMVNVAFLEDSGLGFSLMHPEWYEDVDLAGDTIPVWIMGELSGSVKPGELFAVIVNGRVAAVTQSFQESGDPVFVQAMIRPSALRDGENTITVALWSDGGLTAVASSA